jgi:hypothetical protein
MKMVYAVEILHITVSQGTINAGRIAIFVIPNIIAFRRRIQQCSRFIQLFGLFMHLGRTLWIRGWTSTVCIFDSFSQLKKKLKIREYALLLQLRWFGTCR